MSFDLILAGGGLANALIALRLAKTRPGLSIAIVEAGTTIGGNHTWSSFAADLMPAERQWTEPLAVYRWPAYQVAFPERRRRLAMGYSSATSARLDALVRAAIPADRLLFDAIISTVSPQEVQLDDGRRLTARAVIDGRGQGPMRHLDLRWQKFLGQEVELEADHGLTEPVVMDATVPQLDGYRFVYVLPLSPRTLLIEDTYYSDGPALDPAWLRARIASYAAARGWRIARTIREEEGVLPVALGGDISAFWDEGEPGVPRVGLRAALFHPTTGYSFPDAVRTADLIASLDRIDAPAIHAAVRRASEQAWRDRRFYRALNRMLFLAALPSERYRVLERFYGLDEGLIARFYAGRSTFADKLRLVAGKPPVPIGRAIAALAG